MLRDRDPEPRDPSGRFFEIRSWSAAVTPAIAATGASAMAVHGSSLPPSFENAVRPFSFWTPRADVPNEALIESRKETRNGKEPGTPPSVPQDAVPVPSPSAGPMPTLTHDEGTGNAGDDRHVLHRRCLGEVDPWLADRCPRLDLQRKPRTT